jgi:hypothetical protein
LPFTSLQPLAYKPAFCHNHAMRSRYTITDPEGVYFRKRPVNGIFPNARTCAKISPLQEAHGNGGYRWDEPGRA